MVVQFDFVLRSIDFVFVVLLGGAMWCVTLNREIVGTEHSWEVSMRLLVLVLVHARVCVSPRTLIELVPSEIFNVCTINISSAVTNPQEMATKVVVSG